MDEALCQLLGILVRDDEVGRSVYFSTGSFRQRIVLVRGVLKARIVNAKETSTVSTLLTKIYKSFQVRNKLVHAHYVIVVKNEIGETSYINDYFDEEISFQEPKLTPLYLGRLDSKKETGIAKVNAGTFSNHGDKVDDLLCEIVGLSERILDHQIELFEYGS